MWAVPVFLLSSVPIPIEIVCNLVGSILNYWHNVPVPLDCQPRHISPWTASVRTDNQHYLREARNRVRFASGCDLIWPIRWKCLFRSTLLNISWAWDNVAHTAAIAELASRGALVSANLIMLILVLRRTFFLYIQSRKSQIRTPLLRILLQDGTLLHST